MNWTFKQKIEAGDEIAVLMLSNETTLDGDPLKNEKILFLGNVKSWLKENNTADPHAQRAIDVVFGALRELCVRDYSCVEFWAAAPGSKGDSIPQLHAFVETLAAELRVQPFSLERVTPVDKSRYFKGEKTPERHYGTIATETNVKGKVVGVIDDYVTSGSTLEACRRLLKEAGASKVVLIGIGKMAKWQYMGAKLKKHTDTLRDLTRSYIHACKEEEEEDTFGMDALKNALNSLAN